MAQLPVIKGNHAFEVPSQQVLTKSTRDSERKKAFSCDFQQASSCLSIVFIYLYYILIKLFMNFCLKCVYFCRNCSCIFLFF